MCNRKKSILTHIIFFTLIVSLLLPINVGATTSLEVQPRESLYLSSYGAYIHLPGNGKVQVWFDVQGAGTMDELGALTIEIWESKDGNSWTWKKSFTHDSNPGMLSYNDFFHSSHVEYQGVEGRYYKAYVCVWGGKGGKGDTRYFWTIPQPDLP